MFAPSNLIQALHVPVMLRVGELQVIKTFRFTMGGRGRGEKWHVEVACN